MKLTSKCMSTDTADIHGSHSDAADCAVRHMAELLLIKAEQLFFLFAH